MFISWSWHALLHRPGRPRNFCKNESGRVGEEKTLKDTRALRQKAPSAPPPPSRCQPRISSGLTHGRLTSSHGRQTAATPEPGGSEHQGQCTEEEMGHTDTKSGTKIMFPKSRNGQCDGEFSQLSPAGVHWDFAVQGASLQARPKAGTNEVHMLAQTGPGLPSKSSLAANVRLGLQPKGCSQTLTLQVKVKVSGCTRGPQLHLTPTPPLQVSPTFISQRT